MRSVKEVVREGGGARKRWCAKEVMLMLTHVHLTLGIHR